jgi:hypothetical protein
MICLMKRLMTHHMNSQILLVTLNSLHIQGSTFSTFENWLYILQNSNSTALMYTHHMVPHGELSPSLSAGTRTPFSSSSFAKLPSWCMDIRMSVPPMNSLSTYNCGIVGQSEYSLIPVGLSPWSASFSYTASVHVASDFDPSRVQ